MSSPVLPISICLGGVAAVFYLGALDRRRKMEDLDHFLEMSAIPSKALENFINNPRKTARDSPAPKDNGIREI